MRFKRKKKITKILKLYKISYNAEVQKWRRCKKLTYFFFVNLKKIYDVEINELLFTIKLSTEAFGEYWCCGCQPLMSAVAC